MHRDCKTPLSVAGGEGRPSRVKRVLNMNVLVCTNIRQSSVCAHFLGPTWPHSSGTRWSLACRPGPGGGAASGDRSPHGGPVRGLVRGAHAVSTVCKIRILEES